jgi:hypothetical protein
VDDAALAESMRPSILPVTLTFRAPTPAHSPRRPSNTFRPGAANTSSVPTSPLAARRSRESNNPRPRFDPWTHPAGHHCFVLDVLDASVFPQPPGYTYYAY